MEVRGTCDGCCGVCAALRVRPHSVCPHTGDSDSTGVIAGCCWGALYGLAGVPQGNYNDLEYRERMEAVARALHKLAWGEP